jgi:ferritin-like metal-binding protein YciE
MERRILKALSRMEVKMSAQYESLKADWEAVDAKTTEIATELVRVKDILTDIATKNLSPEEFADLKARAGQELGDLETSITDLKNIAAEPLPPEEPVVE